MAFMSAIGDWLEGSGWTDVFEKVKMSTVGRIECFLSGSKVKRSRYAHQVSLAALVTMSNMVFKSQSDGISYDEWRKKLSYNCATAFYWFTVIDLEIILFMFIRSLREANFQLFTSCLKGIYSWVFALDHVHYARWLPVFIEILEGFMNVFFTVRKSNRSFSNMGIDQAHEQNHKLVKINGGAIGILDNEAAFLKWELQVLLLVIFFNIQSNINLKMSLISIIMKTPVLLKKDF